MKAFFIKVWWDFRIPVCFFGFFLKRATAYWKNHGLGSGLEAYSLDGDCALGLFDGDRRCMKRWG
jgi:hypothetical protein